MDVLISFQHLNTDVWCLVNKDNYGIYVSQRKNNFWYLKSLRLHLSMPNLWRVLSSVVQYSVHGDQSANPSISHMWCLCVLVSGSTCSKRTFCHLFFKWHKKKNCWKHVLGTTGNKWSTPLMLIKIWICTFICKHIKCKLGKLTSGSNNLHSFVWNNIIWSVTLLY